MFHLAPLPRKLAAALRDAADAREDVRLSAIADLVRHARSGESEAEEALAKGLKDASEAVRAQAAMGLADAGATKSVDALVLAASEDVSTRVRQMALLALGELSSAEHGETLDVLLEASRSPEAAERFQSLLGLHQLRAPSAQQVIIEGTVDPDAEVRRLAFRVAEAEWADAALPELVRARAKASLSDAQAPVRVAAALLLARFGDASGEGILLKLVEGRGQHGSAEDEQAAIEAVLTLGLVKAEPLLERRAFSKWSRDPASFHARVALARLGNQRAKDAILRGLDAWTFASRTLAVAAAGRAGLVEARPRIEALAKTPGRADATAVQEALRLLEAEPQETRE